MTRIRSIKPGIVHDQELARCSLQAQALFFYLITQADDQGRHVGTPGAVRGACLPNVDVSMAEVDGWLNELANEGLIIRYEVERRQYLALRSWKKHQRIKDPGIPRIPPPPGLVDADPRENAADSPATPPQPPRIGGRREEGGGKERKENHPVAQARPSDVETVFTTWQQSTGKARAHLDDKRKRLIRKALSTYPVEDIVAAVQGWRHSPHHRGENDRHTVYNDLSLLLRDPENIERFRDFTLGEMQVNAGDARREQMLAALDRSQDQRKELGDGTSPMD